MPFRGIKAKCGIWEEEGHVDVESEKDERGREVVDGRLFDVDAVRVGEESGPETLISDIHQSFRVSSCIMPRVTRERHRLEGESVFWPGRCDAVPVAQRGPAPASLPRGGRRVCRLRYLLSSSTFSLLSPFTSSIPTLAPGIRA